MEDLFPRNWKWRRSNVPPKSSLTEEVSTARKLSSNVTPICIFFTKCYIVSNHFNLFHPLIDFESKAKKQGSNQAKKNKSKEPEFLFDAKVLVAELANKPVVDNSKKKKLTQPVDVKRSHVWTATGKSS